MRDEVIRGWPSQKSRLGSCREDTKKKTDEGMRKGVTKTLIEEKKQRKEGRNEAEEKKKQAEEKGCLSN